MIRHANTGAEDHTADAPYDAFIQKPAEISQLTDEVQRLLKRSR